MRRPLSLTLRLTLLFTSAAASIFALFGWIIIQSTERHFEDADNAELRVIAQAVEQVLSDTQSAATLASIESRFEDILVGHHRASLFIVSEGDQIIYASPESNLAGFIVHAAPQAAGDIVRSWGDADHRYRVLIRHSPQGAGPGNWPYTMAIAVQADYHLRFLDHFHHILWTMIACSIVMMSATGWIAVRHGIAPLRDIVTKIQHVTANKLNTHLSPQTVPRELEDLVNSFNQMFQRVDKAFQKLSQYDADIAHELRTPITSLMTQTQVALSRTRGVDEYREVLYSNMEEYERMAQMINDMLFLAQTDSARQSTNFSTLKLAAEIKELFDYYDGWAEECGVTLALQGSAMARGDRAMLRRALGNLLANAIRHTARGETVRVELASLPDGKASIAIENPGAEIPAEHLPKLFDRFYRVDASRGRGGNNTGLGLAIVKSIVEAHHGDIDVACTAGRIRFQITLPGADG